MFEINDYSRAVNELCKNHNVAKLYLFGSAANNKLRAESDIDFMVKFDAIDLKNYFSNYLDLKQQLEKTFNRPVDLLEEQTLKNPALKKSIDKNKLLVYGRAD